MNKTLKNTLILLSCLLLAAVLLAASLLYGRISMNPKGTVGNTAGNLNNSGLFCEYNGTVYFSNADKEGTLYAMNPDETEVRRLNYQKVRNILAGGKYLYFFQTGAAANSGFGQLDGMKSFARCKLNGKDVTTLTKDVVVTGQLVDNYLYLLTSTGTKPSFYKMKIDRSEQMDLANYNINPACVSDGKIYYNGTQSDHYLYALNPANDVSTEIWRGNVWYPVVEGDYVYYLDVANDYRICRYSLTRDEIQVLTNDRADCFNVGNGFLYYQSNGKNPQLKCMYTDGTGIQTVAEGIYTNINITSRYVYFQPFGDTATMYHSPLGSNGYSKFIPQYGRDPDSK